MGTVMTRRSRERTLVATTVVVAIVLAACGQALPSPTRTYDGTGRSPTPAPSTTPPLASPAPTTAATPDVARGVAARDAYINAICPVFLDILSLDPRLAALRSEGGADGDVPGQLDEIEAVAAELRIVVSDLDAVPDWAAGRLLRFELIGALHEIRSALLRVARDPERHDAAAQLAAIPYISRPAIDTGMGQAADAGLSCDDFG